MASKRQLFLHHVAQTSKWPILLEVSHAEGAHIFDKAGKRYIDMNSGISVSSLGHCHPKVVNAVQDQAVRYMHTMVYGEHVQDPQVDFAKLLLDHVDPSFSSVYYLTAGTEATELSIKLAKKYTGRYEIVACRNAYHGSTHGSESLRSDLSYKQHFMPLLPGIRHINFNDFDALKKITHDTAAFICEPVQAEAGVITPAVGFLAEARKRCTETGTLFILDEIQTGFGRTGNLFAHQSFKVVPDAFLVGKAMGGGMPIAAVVSSSAIMSCLVENPALGHITTFGGHPVCAAAAHACLSTLLEEGYVLEVHQKEELVHRLLKHEIIREIRSAGLMMAVELTKRKYLKHVISKALELGVIVDYFLFNDRSFRLAPPLIMAEDTIHKACQLLLEAMDYAAERYKK